MFYNDSQCQGKRDRGGLCVHACVYACGKGVCIFNVIVIVGGDYRTNSLLFLANKMLIYNLHVTGIISMCIFVGIMLI